MTVVCAVFGNPIDHSRSPYIHRAFAQQTGQDIRYTAVHVAEHAFSDTVRKFFADGGTGLNITLPFKTHAYALCNRRTDAAETAGAVNTLWRQNNILWGDNTDGAGLIRDMQDIPLTNASVLLLGAGGSARGIAPALLSAGIGMLTIANRTQERARTLCNLLLQSRTDAVVRDSTFDMCTQPFDIVINATTTSLHGDLPHIADTCLEGAHVVDLAYDSTQSTVFCRHAASCGARSTRDGFGMLIEQAALSYAVWHGVLPDTAPVRRMLTDNR